MNNLFRPNYDNRFEFGLTLNYIERFLKYVSFQKIVQALISITSVLHNLALRPT